MGQPDVVGEGEAAGARFFMGESRVEVAWGASGVENRTEIDFGRAPISQLMQWRAFCAPYW
jgi:hypothetical protein